MSAEVDILVTIKLNEDKLPPEWLQDLIEDIKHSCSGRRHPGGIPIDKSSDIDAIKMKASIRDIVKNWTTSDTYNLDVSKGDWDA
jgi:hypothetical protein